MDVEAGRMGGGLKGWVLVVCMSYVNAIVVCTLSRAGSLPDSCRVYSLIEG